MHYIYLRVSTDKQADSTAGMNAQYDACSSWCDKEGVSSCHSPEWNDPGVSASIHPFDRPGFGELLKRLEPGDCIVVAKRDRIARDHLMLNILERDLEKDGIRIIDASGSWNGDSPEDKLIKSIMDALAEYERQLIKKRTKLGLAAKKKRGEAYCSRLYGYKVINGEFVKDQYEQSAITIMKNLREDKHTLREIANVINDQGYPPPKGTKWYPGTISTILKREEK